MVGKVGMRYPSGMTPEKTFAEPVPNINGVGYFRFQTYEKPIEALDQALNDARTVGTILKDTLIVLPEAFNIKKPYFDLKEPDVNPAICRQLASRSQEYGCVFVAGLIIDDTPDIRPCYSSAYLIDGASTPVRLARKGRKDNSEVSNVEAAKSNWAPNYTAYDSFEGCSVQHRGISIGALLCMDAECDEFCEALTKSLHGHNAMYSVLCVPAHMKDGFCYGHLGTNVFDSRPWRRTKTVQVFANSHSGFLPSFITDANGNIVRRTERSQPENLIETMLLAELWNCG
jgi:predicted amidohydrolase